MENWDHFMDRCPKEILNAVIMKYISRVTSLSKTKVGKAICGAHLWFQNPHLIQPCIQTKLTLIQDLAQYQKNKILPIVAIQDFAPKLQRLVFKLYKLYVENIV